MSLTPNMHAALDLLASSSDHAFVRLWSEWWVREGDYAGAHQVGPAHVDVTGRLQASGAFWAHRAELTPARLQLQADRVERARVAYGEVLQRVAE